MLTPNPRSAPLKQAKGPVLQLQPSVAACTLSDLGNYVKQCEAPIAIDLFCGAGGLSLGLKMAGFDVVLGVDKDEPAVRTHAAHFGGVSIVRDLSCPETALEICTALKDIPVDLIAGGPPCQPFSQAAFSKVRHLQEHHGRGEDLRRNLWQSYLYIVKHIRPKAVLMENVPEMGFGRDSVILRALVDELEHEGYHVHTRILSAWPYGVPQYRQRLIILGLRDGESFEWPSGTASPERLLREAISDLPPVAGGDKAEQRPYSGPNHHSQNYYRDGLDDSATDLIYDHYTRAVREDDLQAFELMTSQTKYSDLPTDLKRYRDDIFVDKYKRLSYNDLCRTITAHIAKDGYWYIHPEQHRTLTVREAARAQTFPDWFRFSGFPANAFRQIGEAVPPLLGRALGKAILQALKGTSLSMQPETRGLSQALGSWIALQDEEALAAPWRVSGDLWLVLLGHLTLAKATPFQRAFYWRRFKQRWPGPSNFLEDSSSSDMLRELRTDIDLLRVFAEALSMAASDPEKALLAVGRAESTVREVLGVSGLAGRRPVTAQLQRMSERVWLARKSHIDGKGADELLLGRLVGLDPSGRVYTAALEVAEQFCKPKVPHCSFCPLRDYCATSIKLLPAQEKQQILTNFSLNTTSTGETLA